RSLSFVLLARQAFAMNAPGLVPPRTLFAPAGAAANGGRVDEAFSDFVPPLLPGGGPDFFPAAFDAAKRPVDVVAAPHEIRRAVAVVGREQFFVDGNHPSEGLRSRRARRRGGVRRDLFAPRENLTALLLAALHGLKRLIRLCSPDTPPRRFSHRRRADTRSRSCPDRSLKSPGAGRPRWRSFCPRWIERHRRRESPLSPSAGRFPLPSPPRPGAWRRESKRSAPGSEKRCACRDRAREIPGRAKWPVSLPGCRPDRECAFPYRDRRAPLRVWERPMRPPAPALQRRRVSQPAR